MLRAVLLSATLLACAPALAQNYGGTYTAKNASGGNVMLTLTQDGQKRVSGTLTGHGNSSLQVQADRLRFRIGNQSWSYKEFMQRLGDERARLLVYPSVWLLDADAKPLMQMPAGTGTFETVPEQIEVLRLEQ